MLPVIRAVYVRLTGDEELTDMVSGRIFDHTPEDTPYPYIVVGEAIESPDNWHGGFGRQTVLTLHVWSQYRGFTEALRIAARLMALLDHTPLAVDGLAHIATRYESSEALTDPEPPGNIRHVPIRFRVVTEQP